MADEGTSSGAVDVRGHCYCGGIGFRVQLPEGEAPIFSIYCHCDSCRRAHAAPLYQVVAVAEARFELTAGADLLAEFQKPGARVSRSFCKRCGSKICNRFRGWAPGGKVPVAFFPSLLEADIQRDLPLALRPTKHCFRDEAVLDAEVLEGLLAHD